NLINYVDQDGNNVGRQEVTGTDGDPIAVQLPAGYHIDGGSLPSLTLNGKTPVQTVNVVKDQHDTDNPEVVTKPVLNIIKYIDENGNVVKTENVVGKLGYQITLVRPTGYHFNNDETPNLVITENGVQIVNVVKDHQVTPENPTINDHDKKNGNNSAVNNNGASQDNNRKTVSTVAMDESNNANRKQSQLPQTGDETQRGAGLVGLAIAGLVGLFGSAGFRKKRD
ncbi:MAG: MucBP domain-containing protein, partial [Candidatus Limosilactobacillus intestinavium]